MLGHSASLQEDEASALRILDGDDNPEMTNLISHHDVARVVRQCVPVPYDQPWPISPDVTVRFVDAGHLLGSAMIALTIAQAGRTYQVTFTGDLGRRGLPLLRDPAPVPEADLLVCECTYGGRRHDSLQRVTDTLVEVVRRTGERGGKILIPAFTLGRTQLIVFCLREAMRDGRLPQIPVFVDSPLAEDIVAVYRSHLECLDPATAQRLQRGDDLFDGPGVAYLRKQEQSRELGERPGPCVIVAASAMCDAGRILRHLKQNIDDPRCSVVLVSYQAPESLGKRLLEPRPTVRIHGREWNLWADVVDLSSFSGHADHNDFLDLLSPQAGRTKHVRLVHGALDQAEALAGALRARGFADVGIPSLGETICLP
jgi:metallo-beta-lactamase family protein